MTAKTSSPRRPLLLVLMVALGMSPLLLQAADTEIVTNTTQNGGTLAVDSDSNLVISHESNDPTLTLTNEADTSGIVNVNVGLSGGSGNLELLNVSTLTADEVNIGLSGTGTLTVSGSSTVTSLVSYIGRDNGSTGTATVTGEGTLWDTGGNDSLIVGNNGTGTLTISEGAQVIAGHAYVGRFAGSEGSVTVTGSGSNITSDAVIYGLTVGASGEGSLTIEAGAEVTYGYARIGQNLGSEGSVTVTGTGSTLTLNSSSNAFLIVGDSGTGSLTVSAGGTVSNEDAGVQGLNSTVLVTGSNSTWTSSGHLAIQGENASLAISVGGKVVSDSAEIDMGSGNRTVTVTGMGSTWAITEDLVIGDYANGNTLTISDGALVKVGGEFLISPNGGTFSNYLRLDGGYLAWLGDNTTDVFDLVDGGLIQVWSSVYNDWVSAADGPFSATYFATNEAALAFTGYTGLGGYTILAAVPEPSTYAAILGALALGFVALRRRRARVAVAP